MHETGGEIVLILVFVEFTLRGFTSLMTTARTFSLNPCFCGIYSQRSKIYNLWQKETIVLILVFVEFTLRATILKFINTYSIVLILVFVEFTLRDQKN